MKFVRIPRSSNRCRTLSTHNRLSEKMFCPPFRPNVAFKFPITIGVSCKKTWRRKRPRNEKTMLRNFLTSELKTMITKWSTNGDTGQGTVAIHILYSHAVNETAKKWNKTCGATKTTMKTRSVRASARTAHTRILFFSAPCSPAAMCTNTAHFDAFKPTARNYTMKGRKKETQTHTHRWSQHWNRSLKVRIHQHKIY